MLYSLRIGCSNVFLLSRLVDLLDIELHRRHAEQRRCSDFYSRYSPNELAYAGQLRRKHESDTDESVDILLEEMWSVLRMEQGLDGTVWNEELVFVEKERV